MDTYDAIDKNLETDDDINDDESEEEMRQKIHRLFSSLKPYRN